MDSRLYRKSLITAIVGWFGVCPLLAQNAEPSITGRQWRDSLAIVNRQIAHSPYNSDLHLRKAAINLELQQWQYAADEYGIVLQHDDRNPAALFYRAYANTQLRYYDLARHDYETLLTVVPGHFEGRLGLSYVYQKTDRRKDALDQLNRLVQQHPDSAVAYAARAALERDMQQPEAALYDWEQAIRRQPANTGYVISYVDVLLLLHRRDDARQALDGLVKKGVPRGMLREWYEKIKSEK